MEAREKEKAFDEYVALIEKANACKTPHQIMMFQIKVADYLESLWQAGYKKGYAKGTKDGIHEGRESLIKGHLLN